jgi:hypothetical protein
MADVAIIARPATEGTRHALVLTEDRLGHYPEFRAFFVRTFDLDRVGLSEPGFVRAPSGMAYALVFVGRSGEPFPSGLEIYAIVEALEPLDDAVVDKDLWAILGWMIGGVGAPWTVDDLHATGRLYRIPAAGWPDPVGTAKKISHEAVWHGTRSMSAGSPIRPRCTKANTRRSCPKSCGSKSSEAYAIIGAPRGPTEPANRPMRCSQASSMTTAATG